MVQLVCDAHLEASQILANIRVSTGHKTCFKLTITIWKVFSYAGRTDNPCCSFLGSANLQFSWLCKPGSFIVLPTCSFLGSANPAVLRLCQPAVFLALQTWQFCLPTCSFLGSANPAVLRLCQPAVFLALRTWQFYGSANL